MKKELLIAAAGAALLASPSGAFAQRTNENAVAAAQDAFGTSVGNEKIGLYSANDVRGFSPTTAGNIRVDGLSVTEHNGFTNRLVNGSTIRVGLTAQGYPFPAPTGIVDYALKTAGTEAVLSPVAYLGPYGGYALDVDAKLPIIAGRLSLAGGMSFRYEENFSGEDGRNLHGGGVLQWRPADAVDVKAFYGRTRVYDDVTIPSIFVAGPYLPPEIDRDYFGLDYAKTTVERQFYGTVSSVQLADNWQLRAGLFRSESDVPLSYSELYRNVQPDGSAQRQLVVGKNESAASTSGEARSSYSVTEGKRRHTLHLAARGRHTRRAFGGAAVRNLGAAVIGKKADVPEPEYSFGTLTQDRVRQSTVGVGYEGRWLDVAELSLGLQKTDYRKDTEIPGLDTLTTRANPWLYNGTLALHLTKKLAVYGGATPLSSSPRV